MDKLLEVKEYDSITGNVDYKDDEKYKYLDQKTFANLIEFIHEYAGDEENADALDFMRIVYKRNVGDVVTIKNYVGLIQMKNGYQVQVLPKVSSAPVRALLKTPLVGQKLKAKICQQVYEAFGGRLYEIIVGGAALNQEVEQFLTDIGFPITVGYGATECAPIITYDDWQNRAVGSGGSAVIHMEVKINSSDPYNIPGEILTRGSNTMLGYYKNEEATKDVLIDGWYHTGDLGIIDEQGHVFIKGRSKNMLLGASGQNIYPEEIEDKLNSLAYVSECLVVQRGDKLVGLVYPDLDEAKKNNLNTEQIKAVMEQNRLDLNNTQPAYQKLSAIEMMDKEFEKTPKKSIKRYLYK